MWERVEPFIFWFCVVIVFLLILFLLSFSSNVFADYPWSSCTDGVAGNQVYIYGVHGGVLGCSDFYIDDGIGDAACNQADAGGGHTNLDWYLPCQDWIEGCGSDMDTCVTHIGTGIVAVPIAKTKIENVSNHNIAYQCVCKYRPSNTQGSGCGSCGLVYNDSRLPCDSGKVFDCGSCACVCTKTNDSCVQELNCGSLNETTCECDCPVGSSKINNQCIADQEGWVLNPAHCDLNGGLCNLWGEGSVCNDVWDYIPWWYEYVPPDDTCGYLKSHMQYGILPGHISSWDTWSWFCGDESWNDVAQLSSTSKLLSYDDLYALLQAKGSSCPQYGAHFQGGDGSCLSQLVRFYVVINHAVPHLTDECEGLTCGDLYNGGLLGVIFGPGGNAEGYGQIENWGSRGVGIKFKVIGGGRFVDP